MLVVIRFRDESDPESMRAQLQQALAVLAARPGFRDGDIGRNLDDPQLWTLVTRWADTGSYRRALSSYEVKLNAVPLLSRALDEPTAYETGDGELNRAAARQT